NMYTSYCPELDVASCGRTVEEAQKNLIEVILIQLEETAKLGTLKDFLENAGYEIEVEMDELRLDKQLVIFNELAIPLGVL
ncbi:MAG: type II toxin-antitoxin system HicB family antitoxin, partial [Candidatus Poribacteria bacterium]